MKLFAIDASRSLGLSVAKHLGIELSQHEEREFVDGEFKMRALTPVRGEHVCVVHSLYADAKHSPSDKFWRLAVFVGALRDGGAASVTAVIPYLAFARKDQRTKFQDPVTIRYLAQALEAVGCQRVVTLDVHNRAAFENAFRCVTDHLEGTSLFVNYLTNRDGRAPIAVVSPDAGGIKRAGKLAAALRQAGAADVTLGFLEKQRSEGIVSGATDVHGAVQGRTVVILDDLISSGLTINRAVIGCVGAGAKEILAMATHGLFGGDATTNLSVPQLTEIVVTDTVPPIRLDSSEIRHKLRVLEAAPILAAAIEF